MAITAAMVKELRDLTGAGMMDCKKALNETNGNMDEAVEYLKKNGQAKAEKKASRIAAEGLCRVIVKDDTTAAVVEVNSETDFVAKNADFQAYVEAVATQAVESDAADMDAFLAEGWNLDTTKTVKEALVEKIAVIGENLTIRRFKKVVASNGCVVSYTHGGGRIGVIVEADTDVVSDDVKEAMTNVAMQIAALNPQYTSRDEISADELAKMKEITIDSALNDTFSLPAPILKGLLEKAVSVWNAEDVAVYEEKKDNMKYLPNFLSKEAKATLAELAIADKATIVENKIFTGLVEGRVSKQLKEICLLDQTYVKAEDGKQTVAQYVAEVAKATGAKLSLKGFVRFETGEGIAKKEENFAEEVAKQMAGN